MTQPTQAQIEAAAKGLHAHDMRNGLEHREWRELSALDCKGYYTQSEVALAAAAEAEEQKDWRGMYLRDTSKLTDQIIAERNATIERCAQVAKNYGRGGWTGIAAAIMALKDKR